MYFISESNGWKTYALEYLLALKQFHDRGFKIPRELDIIHNTLSEFMSLMFGENNVEWVTGSPKDDQLQKLLETENESDAVNDILEEYYRRDHMLIEIKINDLKGLKTGQYVRLMEILTELCPTDEDILGLGEFPWYELFRSINWLTTADGTVTGLLLHLVDVTICCDEEPQGLGRYYSVFMQFWDQLRTYKVTNQQQEVIENASN